MRAASGHRPGRLALLAVLCLQMLVLGLLVLREERAIVRGRTVFLEVERTGADRSSKDGIFRPNLVLRELYLADLQHDPTEFPPGKNKFREPLWLRLEPDLPCWRPVELRRPAPAQGDPGLWLHVRGTRGMNIARLPHEQHVATREDEKIQIQLALRLFYHPLALPGRNLADEVFPEDGPPLSVRVSVSADGRGTVQDLLVGDVSWDEWIRAERR